MDSHFASTVPVLWDYPDIIENGSFTQEDEESIPSYLDCNNNAADPKLPIFSVNPEGFNAMGHPSWRSESISDSVLKLSQVSDKVLTQDWLASLCIDGDETDSRGRRVVYRRRSSSSPPNGQRSSFLPPANVEISISPACSTASSFSDLTDADSGVGTAEKLVTRNSPLSTRLVNRECCGFRPRKRSSSVGDGLSEWLLSDDSSLWLREPSSADLDDSLFKELAKVEEDVIYKRLDTHRCW